MMKSGNTLSLIGWSILVGGIIIAFILYGNIDHESLKDAKEVYDDLYDNEFARAEYVQEKMMYTADLTIAFLVGLFSIVGGLIIVSLGSIIESLNSKREQFEIAQIKESEVKA